VTGRQLEHRTALL